MHLNNFQKTSITIILISAIFFSTKIIFGSKFNPKNNLDLYQTTVVKIDNKHEFKSYLASTPKQQQIGLMYQTKLSKNSAMLFTFPNSTYQQFWMKNTLIPLDIIFVDNHKIVDIKHNALPCKKDPCPNYASKAPANQVLEINGGLSKQLNITIGQKVVTIE